MSPEVWLPAVDASLIVISGIYYLYSTSSSELAPQEDQGVVILIPSSAPDATLQ